MRTRRAYEFNYPLMLFKGVDGRGRLPKVLPFISVEPDNIILTMVKKAEYLGDMILRLYETARKKVTSSILSYIAPSRCWEVGLMEENESELHLEGDAIRVSLGEYEIKTLRLSFSE